MTRFDKAFSTLSDRMAQGSAPARGMPPAPPIASLIDRVDAAKRRYQPGLGRG